MYLCLRLTLMDRSRSSSKSLFSDYHSPQAPPLSSPPSTDPELLHHSRTLTLHTRSDAAFQYKSEVSLQGKIYYI